MKLPAPSRRKVPAIPKMGAPRGLDIQLRSMSISGPAAASDEESGPEHTKRSRGGTGRPTPRRQQTDADALAAATEAYAYKEERERLAMRDAQAPLRIKPYSAHTQKMAAEIDRRTGNNPDLKHMIADMYTDNAELAVVASPAASSGAVPVYPQLPMQGASDTVQSVMHAVTQNHVFSYYANMQMTVQAGLGKGPPTDPGASWGLLSMGIADRLKVNFVAMDTLTRNFRERMAGTLVTHPVEAERLAEIQPEPQVPVAAAVEDVVTAALGEQLDSDMEL